MSQWNEENDDTEDVDENDSYESGSHGSDDGDESAGSNGEGDDDIWPPNGGSNSAAGPRDLPTWFPGPNKAMDCIRGEKLFSEAYAYLENSTEVASTTVESSLESLETSARCDFTTDDSLSDTDDSSVGSLDTSALSDVRQSHKSIKTRFHNTDSLRSLQLGSFTSTHEAKVIDYNWMPLLATLRHQQSLILPAQLVPGLVLLQLLKACLRVEYPYSTCE